MRAICLKFIGIWLCFLPAFSFCMEKSPEQISLLKELLEVLKQEEFNEVDAANLLKKIALRPNQLFDFVLKNGENNTGTLLECMIHYNYPPNAFDFLLRRRFSSCIPMLNKQECGLLHLAAATDSSAKIVKILLKHGAKPGIEGFQKFTPLHGACSTKVVTALCKAGADVNAQSTQLVTPLMAAVKRGDTEVLKCLCRLGSDPNRKDSYGKTSLYSAVYNGDAIAVCLLLVMNASITEDIQQLALSKERHNKEKFAAGIARLIEGYLGDNEECLYELLQLALSEECPIEFVRTFLERKKITPIKLNQVTLDGHAGVLHFLIQNNKERSQIIRLLVERGAQVDHPNEAGEIPLDLTVRKGDYPCSKTLLECGSPTASSFSSNSNNSSKNISSTGHQTPFYWAILNGQPDLVELLLNYHVVVDTRYYELACQCVKEHENCLKVNKERFSPANARIIEDGLIRAQHVERIIRTVLGKTLEN